MTAEYSLASVLAEICDRAGLPFSKYDVSKIEGTVWGMQIKNDKPAFEHLKMLSEAYFFDSSNHGGILNFVHRGGEVEVEINEDDLIGDSADEVTRKSPEEVVRVLNLNYYDVEGGTDTDKQTSDRSIDTRGEGEESIDMPLVFDRDFAAQQVVIAHKVMIENQRGEIKLSLPDNYLALTPGTVAQFRGERMRVDEANVDDGEQSYVLRYDRKSAYQSRALGVAPIDLPPPVSLVPGATDIQFIDIPILSSQDDSALGYYMAISGSSAAWRGARVELSLDGGQNYIESRTRTDSAIMGELVTPLASSRRAVPDEVNTVDVRIDTYGAGLESRTLEEMLNRQNRAIIGDEIIAIGNVEEISPGVWRLSYLLRGRLHSVIPASHPTGTRFVLLQRNYLEYVTTEQYNIGQQLTFRATSLGTSNETVIAHLFTANSKIEPAPNYLRARRNGGNLLIEWIGTGVKGGRAAVQTSQFFTGYRVDVNGVATDTLDQFVSVSDPGGALTIRVSQLNSITGQGPYTEVTL